MVKQKRATLRSRNKKQTYKNNRRRGGAFVPGQEWMGKCPVYAEQSDGIINAFINTYKHSDNGLPMNPNRGVAGICEFYTAGPDGQPTSRVCKITYNMTLVQYGTYGYCVWGDNQEFHILASNYGAHPNSFKMRWSALA
jgi:hypothetical protein